MSGTNFRLPYNRSEASADGPHCLWFKGPPNPADTSHGPGCDDDVLANIFCQNTQLVSAFAITDSPGYITRLKGKSENVLLTACETFV